LFPHPWLLNRKAALIFFGFCVYNWKKELKRQKQEKGKCFANRKEREYSQWCNLPKPRKLCGAIEWFRCQEFFLLVEACSVNAFLRSLVQSVVAIIVFPTRLTWGYIKLSWNSWKSCLCSRQATCKTISLSCIPNSTECLSSTRCWI
jgi:hypothetical protein